MGQLAERLDNIRVRTRLPNMDIEAELRNRDQITVEFGESVYEFTNERVLEDALASLARLLYAGWQKQYRAAIDDTDLDIDPNDQHDINFRDEANAVEASVTSSDERITLSTVGMREFSARIKPGTLRELKERHFLARIDELAPRLIEEYRSQVGELKVRYYG